MNTTQNLALCATNECHDHDCRQKKTAQHILDAGCYYEAGSFTLSFLPCKLPEFFTVRFTPSVDFTEGDAITIKGRKFTIKTRTMEEPEGKVFSAGAVVQCDIDMGRNVAFITMSGDAHGGTYLKTPNRLMLRNNDGRCQVADPIDPADATPMQWVEKAIAGSGGIKLWDATETYDPLPRLVWGGDNMIYVATQPSGPGAAAGPQDPVTSPAGLYWLTLDRFLGVLPTPTTAQKFYIRADGSDSNDGSENTADKAFRTVMGAYTYAVKNQMPSAVDILFSIETDGEFGVNGTGDGETRLSIGALTSANLYITGTGSNCRISNNAANGYRGLIGRDGGGLIIKNITCAANPTESSNGAWGGAWGVENGTIGYIDTAAWLSVLPGAGAVNNLCFMYADGGRIYLGNPFAATVTMIGNARGYCNMAVNSGFIHIGAGEAQTIFDVGGIANASAPGAFFGVYDNSNVKRFGNTLTFIGSQAGIGERYRIDNYSYIDTGGAGPNFLPGTADGYVGPRFNWYN